MATAFIRRPYEINPDVVTCHCAKCGRLVGASPTYTALKALEDLHHCPAANPKKKSANAYKSN